MSTPSPPYHASGVSLRHSEAFYEQPYSYYSDNNNSNSSSSSPDSLDELVVYPHNQTTKSSLSSKSTPPPSLSASASASSSKPKPNITDYCFDLILENSIDSSKVGYDCYNQQETTVVFKTVMSKPKPQKKIARVACVRCRKAHSNCGDERPCRRCVRLGVGDACIDAPSIRKPKNGVSTQQTSATTGEPNQTSNNKNNSNSNSNNRKRIHNHNDTTTTNNNTGMPASTAKRSVAVASSWSAACDDDRRPANLDLEAAQWQHQQQQQRIDSSSSSSKRSVAILENIILEPQPHGVSSLELLDRVAGLGFLRLDPLEVITDALGARSCSQNDLHDQRSGVSGGGSFNDHKTTVSTLTPTPITPRTDRPPVFGYSAGGDSTDGEHNYDSRHFFGPLELHRKEAAYDVVASVTHHRHQTQEQGLAWTKESSLLLRTSLEHDDDDDDDLGNPQDLFEFARRQNAKFCMLWRCNNIFNSVIGVGLLFGTNAPLLDRVNDSLLRRWGYTHEDYEHGALRLWTDLMSNVNTMQPSFAELAQKYTIAPETCIMGTYIGTTKTKERFLVCHKTYLVRDPVTLQVLYFLGYQYFDNNNNNNDYDYDYDNNKNMSS